MALLLVQKIPNIMSISLQKFTANRNLIAYDNQKREFKYIPLDDRTPKHQIEDIRTGESNISLLIDNLNPSQKFTIKDFRYFIQKNSFCIISTNSSIYIASKMPNQQVIFEYLNILINHPVVIKSSEKSNTILL
ncbi:MAG: hypothetical protein MHMPM18_004697 [Marteilia pararefringens]